MLYSPCSSCTLSSYILYIYFKLEVKQLHYVNAALTFILYDWSYCGLLQSTVPVRFCSSSILLIYSKYSTEYTVETAFIPILC